jgi:hypothetical protein
MKNDISDLIADLLSLPEWAPRRLLHVVGLALCFTGVFFPTVLMHGIEVWAHREASSFMSQISPLLHPAPRNSSPSSPAHPVRTR